MTRYPNWADSPCDRGTRDLVAQYGFHDVIAALARYAHLTGRRTMFSKLNKLYEWAAGSKVEIGQ